MIVASLAYTADLQFSPFQLPAKTTGCVLLDFLKLFCSGVNHNRWLSPRRKRRLLCDITLPNYKSALSLIPARVLIEKAKQIPNKHSNKGLVSKHSLAAFLVGVTSCWHLAGAFHNFWTWTIFTSLEPISAENKSPHPPSLCHASKSLQKYLWWLQTLPQRQWLKHEKIFKCGR